MLIVLLVIILLTAIWYFMPVYRDPIVFHDFITPAERHYIMDKARDKLKPSTVSANKILEPNVRQSETAWLSLKDPIVRKITERCLAMTGDTPIENCEELQVLRYEEGGFYKPHQDVIREQENTRTHTFILALNDGYQGGATVFPNLGLGFKLKAGDVLFFDTLDNYELITSKALHGGMPVTDGEKWICNLWVHKHQFNS